MEFWCEAMTQAIAIVEANPADWKTQHRQKSKRVGWCQWEKGHTATAGDGWSLHSQERLCAHTPHILNSGALINERSYKVLVSQCTPESTARIWTWTCLGLDPRISPRRVKSHPVWQAPCWASGITTLCTTLPFKKHRDAYVSGSHEYTAMYHMTSVWRELKLKIILEFA